MPDRSMTSPPTGATIFWGDNKIQPRWPESGSLQLSCSPISEPNNTAGGPCWHSGPHVGPGTHGSTGPAAPLAIVESGAEHGGGGSGSGNAGSGNPENGRLKQPRPPRQPKQLQPLFAANGFATQDGHKHDFRPFKHPSPLHPGSAKVVVVGSGENKQDPLGSIAGNRNWEQPLDKLISNSTASIKT